GRRTAWIAAGATRNDTWSRAVTPAKRTVTDAISSPTVTLVPRTAPTFIGPTYRGGRPRRSRPRAARRRPPTLHTPPRRAAPPPAAHAGELPVDAWGRLGAAQVQVADALVARQIVRRSAQRHPPHGEDHRTGRDAERHGGVLLDEQDGGALFVDGSDN